MSLTRLLVLAAIGVALLCGAVTGEVSASSGSGGGNCAEVYPDPDVDPNQCVSSSGSTYMSSAMT